MKWFRRLGIAALVLAGLLTALWWEENWRGQRMWEESCTRLRAAGEPVELEDLVPPDIPDEENAAAAPIFAEVFAVGEERESRLGRLPTYFAYETGEGERVREPMPRRPVTKDDTAYLALWQAHLTGYFAKSNPVEVMQVSPDEVLRLLSEWDDEWREAAAAMRRPKCRWPLNYDDPRRVELKHFDALQGLLHVAHPRRLAFAVKGDAEAYAENLITSLRLAQSFCDPPVDLLSHMFGIGTTALTFGDWLNTLACVDLNETQLRALQEEAQGVRVTAVTGMLRCDRVRIGHMLRTMGADDIAGLDNPFGRAEDVSSQAKGVLFGIRPRGWSLIDAAMYQDFILEKVQSCVSPSKGTLNPRSVARIEGETAACLLDAGRMSLLPQVPHILRGYDFILEQTASMQGRANGAVLWCAIERFRLKKGRVPDALGELTPDFIDKLPCDPVNGEPMRYVRKGEGDYLVYSIGWNLKDDGGVVGRSDGDWVWASHPKWMVNPALERRLAEEREMAREEEDEKEGEVGSKD